MKKRYIVRKYVYAESAEAALKADKKTPADDVILDMDWLAENTRAEIGFKGNS